MTDISMRTRYVTRPGSNVGGIRVEWAGRRKTIAIDQSATYPHEAAIAAVFKLGEWTHRTHDIGTNVIRTHWADGTVLSEVTRDGSSDSWREWSLTLAPLLADMRAQITTNLSDISAALDAYRDAVARRSFSCAASRLPSRRVPLSSQ